MAMARMATRPVPLSFARRAWHKGQSADLQVAGLEHQTILHIIGQPLGHSRDSERQLTMTYLRDRISDSESRNPCQQIDLYQIDVVVMHNDIRLAVDLY
eukprot:scaffold2939_cov123-Cylindrotheca_fusiformis.AAC.9